MKILYLKTDIHTEPLIAGGSISHMIGVLKGFIELKYSIVMATSVDHPDLTTLSLQEKCILKMPAWFACLRWKLNCLFSTLFFLPSCLRLVRRYKPTLLYQRYSPFNITGILLQKITGIPLILEYNGSEVWALTAWGKKKRKTYDLGLAIMQYCEKLNLKYASKIVVVSKALKEQIEEATITKAPLVVAPNGVDTNLFDPSRFQSLIPSMRTTLLISPSSFVVGFIGTFGAWHGIEVLADLIASVAHLDSSIHFLLIGDGILLPWLKDTLKNKAVSNVTFTGLVEPSQAQKYLAVCDAFICPTQPNKDGSRFFGSPTKVFEYLSLGKPVIASDLEQLSEIISPALSSSFMPATLVINDQVGIVVQPNDHAGFLEALLSLKQLPKEDREKMECNARAKALKHYTWRQHVQTIIEAPL